MGDTKVKDIETDELEEEESYMAFLFDNYSDKDYDGYDLIAHDDERIINWDDDDYEFYDDVNYYEDDE